MYSQQHSPSHTYDMLISSDDERSAYRPATSRLIHFAFWGILPIVILAEVLLLAEMPTGTWAVYVLMLAGLVGLSAWHPGSDCARLAVVLMAVPLSRFVILGVSANALAEGWTAAPVVLAFLALIMWRLMRLARPSRHMLFVAPGSWWMQAGIVCSGVPLAVLWAYVLQTAPSGEMPDVHTLLIIVLIASILEEIYVRGITQAVALPVLGHAGFLYVVLLCGVLALGYATPLVVLWVMFQSLLLGSLAALEGSFLGVAGARLLAVLLVGWVPLPLVAADTMLFSILALLAFVPPIVVIIRAFRPSSRTVTVRSLAGMAFLALGILLAMATLMFSATYPLEMLPFEVFLFLRLFEPIVLVSYGVVTITLFAFLVAKITVGQLEDIRAQAISRVLNSVLLVLLVVFVVRAVAQVTQG